MKKLLLLAGLLSLGAVNAQIALTHDGIPFVDGETFTYHTTNNENLAVQLPILATNNTAAEIYMQIRVDEVVNNPTGAGVALCFVSVCFNDIQVGDVVPPAIQNIPIAAGESNPIVDHFFSTAAGDGINPVQYKLTFLQVDSEGNILDEMLSFFYRYEPTAGVDNFEALKNMGITVNNTVVKNTLNIDATVNAGIQLYDTNGKLVKSAKVENGSQSIDLSELSTAVYIAKFLTQDNKSTTIRIVKN
jgi:hypothetical protein